MSQWDGLTDDDQAYALALAGIEAGRCTACGGENPKDLCQNPDLQHAWVLRFNVCYRTKTQLEAMQKRKDDPLAGRLIPVVTLDPALAKSARKT